MVCWLLIIVPLIAAFMCASIRWNAMRRGLFLIAAATHTALTAATWLSPPQPVLFGWLGWMAPGASF